MTREVNRRPNLWGGGGNLKFSRMIDIYKMVAIFWFFDKDQCWYSISINTQKTGDANFPLVQFSEFSIGSVFPITHPRFCFNLKHLCMDIYAWWPFCVAVVNRLGDSDESPMKTTISLYLPRETRILFQYNLKHVTKINPKQNTAIHANSDIPEGNAIVNCLLQVNYSSVCLNLRGNNKI